MSAETLTVRGSTVQATSPEGVTATMSVGDFMGAVAPPSMSSCGILIPHGVRLIHSTRRITIMVWEIEPRVHRLKWISKSSKAPHGGTGRPVLYEFRRLALPYLILVAVFIRGRAGRLVLSGRNEAYFRNQPITSRRNELSFPALLNISKFRKEVADRSPLAWICTQNTNLAGLAKEPDDDERIRKSLEAVRSTTLETGFNYSSEHHELTSYWSLSAKRIPEVADLDQWEKRSVDDPLFVLELPWLPAGSRKSPVTIEKLFARIVDQHRAAEPPLDSAQRLCGIVYHHAAAATGKQST